MDLIVTAFYKEYNINLLEQNISFKLYCTLLGNLPSNNDLIKIINLRSTPDYELQDPKLIQLKRKLSLKRNTNTNDPLKQFALLMKGDK